MAQVLNKANQHSKLLLKIKSSTVGIFKGEIVPIQDAKISIMTQVELWHRCFRRNPRLLE
jgi:hypothetical protein